MISHKIDISISDPKVGKDYPLEADLYVDRSSDLANIVFSYNDVSFDIEIDPKELLNLFQV